MKVYVYACVYIKSIEVDTYDRETQNLVGSYYTQFRV